jgi:hypothetical protein
MLVPEQLLMLVYALYSDIVLTRYSLRYIGAVDYGIKFGYQSINDDAYLS